MANDARSALASSIQNWQRVNDAVTKAAEDIAKEATAPEPESPATQPTESPTKGQ